MSPFGYERKSGPRRQYVRSTPSKRHSGQGWECLKVTQAVRKRFSRGRDEILSREFGLCRNNDSPTPPSGFNYCAEGLSIGVFTQPGPTAEVKAFTTDCRIPRHGRVPDWRFSATLGPILAW